MKKKKLNSKNPKYWDKKQLNEKIEKKRVHACTTQWTELKSLSVIKLATIASKLRNKRMSIKNIAEVLGKSESRIREYLKNE